MNNQVKILLVVMVTIMGMSVSYANSEEYHKVVSMTDIVDDGDQNVKFIDKKGECYYLGKATVVSVENANVFGVEIPDVPESKLWDLKIEKKVCQNISYDQTLYVVPDEKTINRKNNEVLIPAGTEFLVFPSKEELKKHFYQK